MMEAPIQTAISIPSGITNKNYALLWYLGLQRHIFVNPRFAPLAALFHGDTDRMADFEYVRGMHFAAMRRIFRALRSDVNSLMVEAIRDFVDSAFGIRDTPASPGHDQAAAQIVAQLDHAGHAMLPPISAEWVAEMRAYFENSPVQSGVYKAGGPVFSVDAVTDANIANYPAATVLACPHVLEIASDPLVLSVVAQHLGAPPVILGYTAWWSFIGRSEARDAQLFHLDNADYAFCKLFIQLTDVDMSSGPHAFMPRTHDANHVAALRTAWPGGVQAFDDWYFMTMRKTDEDTQRYLGGEPDFITGPAGTCFLANTRGIHKGLLPMDRNRLVCQIVYGVSPSMQPTLLKEDAFPVSRASAFPEVPAHIVNQGQSGYLHRLFLTP